jgi:CBS domain-containing protein
MTVANALVPFRPNLLAPPFERAKVYDVMHAGMLTCAADTAMAEVARLMATHRVHCIVVADPGGEFAGKRWDRPWAVISDLDLVSAADGGLGEAMAGEVAATELVTVTADDDAGHAARMMAEHEVTHLVVVHPDSGRPVGIVSALDLAGALGFDGDA